MGFVALSTVPPGVTIPSGCDGRRDYFCMMRYIPPPSMSFGLLPSRSKRGTIAYRTRSGWGIWIIASALIGVSAAAYLASASRRRDRRTPAVETGRREAAKQREKVAAETTTAMGASHVGTPLPVPAQWPRPEALAAPSREEVLRREEPPVDLMVAESAIDRSFGSRRISTRNPLPDSWPLIASERTQPLGALAPDPVRPNFVAGSVLSPRRGKKRRTLTAAAIIVSSIAIGYAALGAMRSHTRNPGSGGDRSSTRTSAPVADESLLAVDVGDQPSPSGTVEVPPKVEPAPPAEGGDQAASPAPAATATAKTRAHSRKHKPRMRSDRASTGKTSELLRKYL
ncbi:MAG: hypothetical protein JWO45_2197 [Spartobacteria bacterium]|nr:hypothetical protein [Spartobacteria bacterium]